MRRHGGLSFFSLAACLLSLAVAPVARAEAQGTIVLVADGPAYGTLTLPRQVRWGDRDPVLTSPGGYAVFSVTGADRVTFSGVRVPGATVDQWEFRDGDWFPRGTSTIRLLAEGHTTLRIPVTGLSGTRTVRLTRRLQGATAVVRSVTATAANVVVDDIPLIVPRRGAIIAHGIVRRYTATVQPRATICAERKDVTCTPLDTAPSYGSGFPLPTEWVSASMFDHRWTGDGHAYAASTDVGAPLLSATHFAFVLPLA